MNAALTATLGLLVICALASGMLWVALGICVIILVSSLSSQKEVPKRAPMFYKTPNLGKVSEGMEEKMLRVKFLPDWSGWEDDYGTANNIAEPLGTGIGRGLGLLR